MDADFSSNRCITPLVDCEAPTRHTDLYFDDGNLCIVTGQQYFVVHRGLLCRRSIPLKERIEAVKEEESSVEGLAVLYLDDEPADFAHFLRALYGYVLALGLARQMYAHPGQAGLRHLRGSLRCYRRDPPSLYEVRCRRASRSYLAEPVSVLAHHSGDVGSSREGCH